MKEMTHQSQTPITFYGKMKGGIQNSRKSIQKKDTMRLVELNAVTYGMHKHDWNDNYKSTCFNL